MLAGASGTRNNTGSEQQGLAPSGSTKIIADQAKGGEFVAKYAGPNRVLTPEQRVQSKSQGRAPQGKGRVGETVLCLTGQAAREVDGGVSAMP